ncbi:hypothetical protein [Pseudonocardia humida]|uniref:Uncharacterized protein n=1 Tax=Pseudonocardia humida TaxID=2800819 RepID=A0ABT1A7E4_9PSEU|nr:hypothetical protein [Pseudonocardia humida]MCO1658886.1 hypothetical protein [Pseudonocardia humida]
MPSQSTAAELRVLFAEIATVGGLGLLLYLLDVQELAQITWIIGAFQILGRYLLLKNIREEVKQTRAYVEERLDTIDRMTQFVDLSRSTDSAQLRQLQSLYYEIVEPDFARVKEQILTDAQNDLERLARLKRSNTLVTGEYYRWLLPMLRDQPSGGEIWAVSMMLECEWDDTPEEREFLDLNVAAVQRGVTLARTFVVPQAEIETVRALHPVAQQIAAGPRADIRYVTRERLRAVDPQLLSDLGDGLIAFDRRVVLVDEHSQDGTARGYVTMNRGEIATYRRRFDNLRTYTTRYEVLPPPSS